MNCSFSNSWLNWAVISLQDSVGIVGDGAPVKLQKRKLASAKALTPRHREISWTDKEKRCTALEVYMNTIIVGWNNGQIKIYDSTNLNCQKVLNYRRSAVTCHLLAVYWHGNNCGLWRWSHLRVEHPRRSCSAETFCGMGLLWKTFFNLHAMAESSIGSGCIEWLFWKGCLCRNAYLGVRWFAVYAAAQLGLRWKSRTRCGL